MAFNYEGVDMERAMQAKKREILQELTDAKLRILKELSCVDKTTLTRLRQILDDYNRIEYAITQKINIIEQKVTEACEQMNDTNVNLEDNLVKIEEYMQNFDELKTMVDEVDTAVNNLSSTVNDVAQHKTDIATLQAQVAVNVENINTNASAITALQDADTEIDTRVTANETDIATLKSNLDALSEDGTLTDGEILNIRTLLTEMREDIDELGITDANNGNAITALDARVATAENDIDLLEARVTVNETNINSLQTSVNDCFQSVSSGKETVANAITDMGVTTASDATFATMATNIKSIKTAPDYENFSGETIDATEFITLDDNAYIDIPKTGIYNKQSKLKVPVQTVINNVTNEMKDNIKLLAVFHGSKTEPDMISNPFYNENYLTRINNFKYQVTNPFTTTLIIAGGLTNYFGIKINDVVVKNENMPIYKGAVIYDYNFDVGDVIEFTWSSGHSSDIGFTIKI